MFGAILEGRQHNSDVNFVSLPLRFHCAKASPPDALVWPLPSTTCQEHNNRGKPSPKHFLFYTFLYSCHALINLCQTSIVGVRGALHNKSYASRVCVLIMWSGEIAANWQCPHQLHHPRHKVCAVVCRHCVNNNDASKAASRTIVLSAYSNTRKEPLSEGERALYGAVVSYFRPSRESVHWILRINDDPTETASRPSPKDGRRQISD
eukprot:3716174-Amphidinium_carterae.1